MIKFIFHLRSSAPSVSLVLFIQLFFFFKYSGLLRVAEKSRKPQFLFARFVVHPLEMSFPKSSSPPLYIVNIRAVALSPVIPWVWQIRGQRVVDRRAFGATSCHFGASPCFAGASDNLRADKTRVIRFRGSHNDINAMDSTGFQFSTAPFSLLLVGSHASIIRWIN